MHVLDRFWWAACGTAVLVNLILGWTLRNQLATAQQLQRTAIALLGDAEAIRSEATRMIKDFGQELHGQQQRIEELRAYVEDATPSEQKTLIAFKQTLRRLEAQAPKTQETMDALTQRLLSLEHAVLQFGDAPAPVPSNTE